MRQSIFLRLLSFVTLGAAQLDKPALSPSSGSMDPGLLSDLSPPSNNYDTWGVGWIPADCADRAIAEGFRPQDFYNININYSDCGSSWVFCRHISAPVDDQTLIDYFGRLPVKMRSAVRHVIALPGARHAYSYNDNIVMFGSVVTTPSVWIHETSHSVDGHCFESYIGAGNRFSDSSIWIDNYNQDTNVYDDYARTNQAENFAQETVVAVFDKVAPGGFGSVCPNWSGIFHQYATIQGYAGDTILPGGTCPWRLVNSAPIQNGYSGKRYAQEVGDAPDVSLAPGTIVKADLPVPYMSPVYYPPEVTV